MTCNVIEPIYTSKILKLTTQSSVSAFARPIDLYKSVWISENSLFKKILFQIFRLPSIFTMNN